MVLESDGAARALVLADREELLKGGGAIDRGLVVTGRLVNGVGAAVALEASFL